MIEVLKYNFQRTLFVTKAVVFALFSRQMYEQVDSKSFTSAMQL